MSFGKIHLQNHRIIQDRILLAGVFVMLLVLILGVRLGYLQIVQHEQFKSLAQRNSIEQLPVPPVRGLIYDRNGEVLAQNFQVFNLEVLPDKVDDMAWVLDQLGQIVKLTREDLARFRALLQKRPSFERQTLRANLSEKELSRLAINLHRFPGIELKARLQRKYPRGDLTSHVVGYMGRISAEDLEQIDNQAYWGLDYIGKSGIEAFYESTLLGRPGVREVETNAHGKVIRILDQMPAVAGNNLHISLDVHLQEKAMELLQGFEGAVVAMEPATGDILAFASVPSYDPNPFVNGIDRKSYELLRTSDRRPLLNRALSGRYPPGSTIKGFMSLVGMQNGIDPNERVYCNGVYTLPNSRTQYKDWKKEGHGSMNAQEAIEQSCNVYYYHLAQRLGITAIHRGMGVFGFGQATGVDLLGEPSGLLPSREWKKENRGENWMLGETVIVGIGQGYTLMTPLQLASATAALANRGRRVKPRFLMALETPQSQTLTPYDPEPVGQIEQNRLDHYEYVISGMRNVVHGDHGTARALARSRMPYEMAGKTGTAQVSKLNPNEAYREETTEKRLRDHSLFVGFAPVENPRIAVAVIVEHGGGGSKTAAPIAKQVIDYYLINRLDLFSTVYPAESSRSSVPVGGSG